MGEGLPVVLFGYDSSAFTQKIRLALKLKGIKYDFIIVPSMMPRPILTAAFHLTYRKIPVLAIGHDVYCDTSHIIEALEYHFPAAKGYKSLYPRATDGRTHRPLMRGFASYWTDRPLFRTTTGLIPASVWRSAFGRDRAGLIGHVLDPDKLERKVPRNLAGLDLQLSLLEPQLENNPGSQATSTPWLFSTPYPSAADIALFYQLDWINEISAGRGLNNLTGGELSNSNRDVMGVVFNPNRYPALCKWFRAMKVYFDGLPEMQEYKGSDARTALEKIRNAPDRGDNGLLPTPNAKLTRLEEGNGLVVGAQVIVAPDDTGRDDPIRGKLLALSPEEVVIEASPLEGLGKPLANVRLHFPRVGFVVLPRSSKL